MTEEQVAGLEPAFSAFLSSFRRCFPRRPLFVHLGAYCRGLISDLSRKSVEPIALASGCAVRSLQLFLTQHKWDHDGLLAAMQRRIVADHLPAPGQAPADKLGVIGIIDETSVAKKGNKTPGVQRQYCGASGKIDNCIVTVHLVVKHGGFLAMLDSELYLPEASWDLDRKRCEEAHIPEDIAYRSKWIIALEEFDRAAANGVRFDWLTFDEWYGAKPEFLFQLEERGMNYIAEVPKSFMCWPTLPKYNSSQAPFAAKRADNAATHGKPFIAQAWKRITLQRETQAPHAWKVKAAQVYLKDSEGRPTQRTYWLVIAKNTETDEIKYFVSNAPPKTALLTLLKVAFCRWKVEHAFRLAKTEVGFGHFEGRSWLGLLRHMILCQIVLLFVAEQTTLLRGEKSGPDNGADRPRPQYRLRPLATTPTTPPLQRIGA